jgi:hypothetical protein
MAGLRGTGSEPRVLPTPVVPTPLPLLSRFYVSHCSLRQACRYWIGARRAFNSCLSHAVSAFNGTVTSTGPEPGVLPPLIFASLVAASKYGKTYWYSELGELSGLYRPLRDCAQRQDSQVLDRSQACCQLLSFLEPHRTLHSSCHRHCLLRQDF